MATPAGLKIVMTTRRGFLQYALLAAGAYGLGGPRLGAAASSEYGIVGRNAPEIELDYWIDADGKPTSFRLADHPDKWIFLKCFQSWCPGCHSHGLPAVKRISDALADNPRVAFAGIQTVFEGFGVNTVDKVREIQLQYDLRIPMGHDPGDHDRPPQTMLKYRTGGTPWMILITPQRQVVYNDFSINADKAIEFLQSETA